MMFHKRYQELHVLRGMGKETATRVEQDTTMFAACRGNDGIWEVYYIAHTTAANGALAVRHSSWRTHSTTCLLAGCTIDTLKPMCMHFWAWDE